MGGGGGFQSLALTRRVCSAPTRKFLKNRCSEIDSEAFWRYSQMYFALILLLSYSSCCYVLLFVKILGGRKNSFGGGGWGIS